MGLFLIRSCCLVVVHGSGPGPDPGSGPASDPGPGPKPVLGLGPAIFLVPVLVPVSSYCWSRSWSRSRSQSKCLVLSHSGDHQFRLGVHVFFKRNLLVTPKFTLFEFQLVWTSFIVFSRFIIFTKLEHSHDITHVFSQELNFF